MEVMEIADFVILHLFQLFSGTLSYGLGKFLHENLLVRQDLLKNFIDVPFNGKQVSFDALFLKELYLRIIKPRHQLRSRQDTVKIDTQLR